MASVDDLLSTGAAELGLVLQPGQVAAFKVYSQMLVEWNTKMNLTAILDPQDIAVKHFIDSLSLLTLQQFEAGVRIIDVGTGAGFPGIPLKIARPDLDLVLLDSLHKRTQFLQEVIDQLSLSHVTIVHGRAEDLGRNAQYRESFDIALSRAVAPLNILTEYCLPFVKVGGFFIAMKGPDVQQELVQAHKALTLCGGKAFSKNLLLPISGDPRSIVIVEKVHPTPHQYPRRPGIPEKKPLI